MVIYASLLNTQHYKVQIKGEGSNTQKGAVPSPTPQCSSYWKESLRVALNKGRQLVCVLTFSKNTSHENWNINLFGVSFFPTDNH